ncbi:MAG: RNA pseudouridine synthase, partial [Bacteroidales bacterium]|nr:RNA pseudouridine synthase [Bacteroidales bacterium]
MRTESDNGNILYQFKVEKEAPLLEFLYDVLKQQSKSNVKGYLRRGQVTVDSKVVTAFDWSLHKGERVTILRKGEKGKSVMPLKGIKVIYEDRYLIVIVKDAGV